MHFLPVELLEHILSFVPLEYYKDVTLVSHQWYAIAKDNLIRTRLNNLNPFVIASMVKKNSPILIEIKDKLPPRFKKYLCAFYAYLGYDSDVRYYMNRYHFSENERYTIAAYAIFGGNHEQFQNLLDHELTRMQPTINFIKYDKQQSELIISKYDTCITTNYYGDNITQFLINHRDDFIKTETIASTAVVNNRLDILVELNDKHYNFLENISRSWMNGVINLYLYAVQCRNMAIIEWLAQNIKKPLFPFHILEKAIEMNDLNMVQFLISKLNLKDFSDELINTAVKTGNLEMVKYCNQTLEISIRTETFLVAVSYNQKHIATWISELPYFDDFKPHQLKHYEFLLIPCESDIVFWLLDLIPVLSEDISIIAAIHGKVSVINHIIDQSYSILYDQVLEKAAINGQLAVLQLIHEYNPILILDNWNNLTRIAVLEGWTGLVRWLISIWKPEIKILDSCLSKNTLYRYQTCYMDDSVREFIKTNTNALMTYHIFTGNQ